MTFLAMTSKKALFAKALFVPRLLVHLFPNELIKKFF